MNEIHDYQHRPQIKQRQDQQTKNDRPGAETSFATKLTPSQLIYRSPHPASTLPNQSRQGPHEIGVCKGPEVIRTLPAQFFEIKRQGKIFDEVILALLV